MAWMPSYASPNKETSQQFGIGQISDFDRRDEQCAKSGFAKRHIHWGQPPSPKRYRSNSASCVAADLFNFDTRAFAGDDMFPIDDWFSTSNYSGTVSTSYPSNYSTYQSTSYPANYNVGQQSQVVSQQNLQPQQPQQQQFQHYQYPINYQQQLQVYPALVDDVQHRQQQRLEKTTEILKEGGLYDVAVKTASLIRQHEESKKELEELRAQTKLFLNEVLNNPENRKVNQVLQNMQLQQDNRHLSAEQAVRNLFDQSSSGSVR